MKKYLCLIHVNIMLKVLFIFLVSVYVVRSEKVRDLKQVLNVSSTIEQDNGAPLWTNEKKMKEVFRAEPAGNRVTFRCRATGAEPIVTEWFKDDKKIINDGRVGGYKFHQNRQIIKLDSVVLSDRGKYRCEVSNAYGQISHVYELEIAERSSASAPYFQDGLLQNQTVYVGAEVTFRCRVFGNPHPHVQWLFRKKQHNIGIDDIAVTKVIATGADMQTLTLNNVTFADEGEYTCLAGNFIGVSYVSAFLTVFPEPTPVTPQTGQIDPHPYKTNFLIYGFASLCAIVFVTFVIYTANVVG